MTAADLAKAFAGLAAIAGVSEGELHRQMSRAEGDGDHAEFFRLREQARAAGYASLASAVPSISEEDARAWKQRKAAPVAPRASPQPKPAKPAPAANKEAPVKSEMINHTNKTVQKLLDVLAWCLANSEGDFKRELIKRLGDAGVEVDGVDEKKDDALSASPRGLSQSDHEHIMSRMGQTPAPWGIRHEGNALVLGFMSPDEVEAAAKRLGIRGAR